VSRETLPTTDTLTIDWLTDLLGTGRGDNALGRMKFETSGMPTYTKEVQ